MSTPPRASTFVYATIAFLAGFGVLAVEIAGARLLASSLGNSIYTWSALIAAVLLSLSIGNFVGGKVIDHSPRHRWLAGALAVSALTTALVPLFANAALGALAGSGMSIPQEALLICGVVFVLPSFFYGTVSPCCVRLLVAEHEGKGVGTSAGVVSMAGSLGSFLGALATPFFLMPYIRLESIFFLIAGLVLASALLLRGRGRGLLAAGAALCLATPFFLRAEPIKPPRLAEENTPYHRIRVEEQPAGDDTVRLLYLDTTLEGGIFVNNHERLPLSYQNSWGLVKRFGIDVRRALCIGAGAFGVPLQLARTYPEAQIDVIEIDPRVIATGRQFFNLDRAPNIHPIEADGRVFLNRTKEKYDVIFIDAYHGLRYIPPHLTTTEFFALCREHLNPGGLVLMNIISSVTGESNSLYRAFATTVSSAFPYVGAAPLDPMHPGQVQNIVMVASVERRFETDNNPIMPISPTLAPLLLTDAKNPIEMLLARQLRVR